MTCLSPLRAFGVGLLLILFCGLAAHAQRATPQPAVPGLTMENFPRVNGATIQAPLMKLLALRVLGLPGSLGRYADYGQLMVYFPVQCDPQEIQSAYKFINQSGRVKADGNHLAYLTLIEGSADLILVPNTPTDDEIELLKSKKLELDVRPMGLDALVFLVNRQNAVENLTMDKIRDIFSGKTKTWKSLAGKDELIRPFIRDRNSGSEELMWDLVCENKQELKPQGELLLNLESPIDQVARAPAGIAYSVFYYEEYMNRHPQNKLVAVNGVQPTTETVASRKYPLTAAFYVVTRKDIAADSPTARFRDWILSDAGQRVVLECGCIPNASPKSNPPDKTNHQ